MKYRIFIVEDDETIANLLKKHHGHEPCSR